MPHPARGIISCSAVNDPSFQIHVKTIRREVRERIATVGEGGGLIISPAYDLEPEVRWENVEAFFAAARELGRYE